MTTQPANEKAMVEEGWRCAGCGVSSPNRVRSCECATKVVCSGPLTERRNAWKVENHPSDALGALKWIAEYTDARSSLEMSNINSCANKALTAAPRALPADDVGEIIDTFNSVADCAENTETSAYAASTTGIVKLAPLLRKAAALLQQNARLTTAIAEAERDRNRWKEESMQQAATINRLAAAAEDRNEVDKHRDKFHAEELAEERAKGERMRSALIEIRDSRGGPLRTWHHAAEVACTALEQSR